MLRSMMRWLRQMDQDPPSTERSLPTVTELMNREGTDKAKWYGGLYDALLMDQRESVKCVIEIGIGTLVPEARWGMRGCADATYRPGGSLRAWRDYFPHASIIGVDVEPDTQFIEPRIQTHLCTSTNSEDVRRLLAGVDVCADLIVDDGEHLPEAQVKTFLNFSPVLRRRGLYVIEDVEPEKETVGWVLNQLSASGFQGHSFVCRPQEGYYVAIVNRKA